LNRRDLAHDTGAITVGASLVVGVSLAASAISGLMHDRDRYRAEASKPRQTVTRTAPPASSTPAKPARSHTSAPVPRVEPTGGNVIAASAPQTGGSSTAQRPGPGAPSGPVPKPPAATSSCDVGLTALVLNACVNLGGTR
jgi:hypothetical protein